MGLDAARRILEGRPNAAILVLSMACEPHQIVAARRAGIRGYVHKTQAADELLTAIQTVAAGHTYMSETVSRLLLLARGSGGDAALDPLTRREREVLQLVAEGKKTKQIAVLLGMSVQAAESYRADVMLKLNAHDTASLVRYAVRRGLIQAAIGCCGVL
jgi:DNA-binding NarL/FixJ family response regulator